MRCLADPLGDTGGGAGEEAQPDPAVRRIVLHDRVAQLDQLVGQFEDPSPYVRSQPGGQRGERRLQGERDAQAAGVAAHRLGQGERGRAVQVPGVVAARRVQEQGRVGDRASEGAVDGDAVEGLATRPGRDTAALRLDADEVRPGGGDAHRTGAVRAERRRDQPRGHRSRRATGRTPGSVKGVPRIAGRAERRTLGERPLPELAGVGLPDDDRPGRAQPSYGLTVLGHRRELATAAERGRFARHVHVVLDGDRHSEERFPYPGGELLVRRVCLGEGRLPPEDPKGVQGALS